MKKATRFQSANAVDSLARSLEELLSDGFSPPISFAWLAPDGSAQTGIYREESGRLVCQPTAQWSASGLGFPPPLVGLFIDSVGEIALLSIDAEGRTALMRQPSADSSPSPPAAS
jgi:hypothetical protein